MINGQIAGHMFKFGLCATCPRKFMEIKDADDSDIGKTDIAHVGALNLSELNEIRAAKERMLKAVDLSFGWR